MQPSTEPLGGSLQSAVTVLRSLLLFMLAAVAEIGGAWLVWQGVREHRGPGWIATGILAPGAYGLLASLQPDAHFGRVLKCFLGVVACIGGQ